MMIFMTLVQLAHQTVIYQFDAMNNNRDSNCLRIYKYNRLALYWLTQFLQLWSGLIFWVIKQLLNYNKIEFYYHIRILKNLDPHSHIIIDAEILSIDFNFIPQFKIDFFQRSPQTVAVLQNQFCNGTQSGNLYTISLNLAHNRRTVWIGMELHSGGLIKLKLSITKCQNECAGCIENYQMSCSQWKLHQYSFNLRIIIYSDGWSAFSTTLVYLDCGGCQFVNFSMVEYFTKLPPHQDILIRFYKLGNTIIVDYIYGQQITDYGYS